VIFMRSFVDMLVQFDAQTSTNPQLYKRSGCFLHQSLFRHEGVVLDVFSSEQANETLPVQQARNGGWHTWMFGEVSHYFVDTKTGRLPIEVFTDQLASGSAEPSTLNGHFLLCAWKSDSREWHVWTDRFATYHAYYATDGRRAAVGTFFPAVAAAASRRQLDWEGLAGFFACGFFPQDRTYFDDVRILRPASHYVFDQHGRLVSQERYWQWRYQPDPRRSYDETVAEFGQLLDEVMRDHTSAGRVALPISGGLDSRTTVASATGSTMPARSSNGDLWSYSYDYAGMTIETDIARRVAAARGLAFQALAIQPYLFERLDLVLDSVEGFQDVTQCRQAAAIGEIASHADFLIAAHWGDVWLDDMGLIGREQSDLNDDHVLDHAGHKMRKRGRAWLLDQIARLRLEGREPEDVVRGLLRDEMERVRQIDDPDFRVKAFKTDQWSFRWTTASLRMFQAAAFPRLPFYDTRMADFFCTVPSEFVRGRRLQIDYLKRFAPDLARVPWQVYDANLFRYQHFNTWHLPKRAIKKVWRMARRRPVVERNWEVQLLSEQGRQGLDRWLVQPGLRLHDLVAPAKVCSLIDAFYAAPLKEGRGYTISMLLTFSAWLERYA
jgi:asparagine synthase (glutamine-hydrolysing)